MEVDRSAVGLGRTARQIAQDGMRNSQLRTTAPATATISAMAWMP